MSKSQRTTPADASAIDRVQGELEIIADEAAAEVLLIERLANQRRAPLYEKRRDAIASVPGFWRSALLGHPLLSMLITPLDSTMLESLEDLAVEEHEDDGYRVVLTFGPNPHFSNRQLSRVLTWHAGGGLTLEATTIEWKAGHHPSLAPSPPAAAAPAAGGAAGGADDAPPPLSRKRSSDAARLEGAPPEDEDDDGLQLPIFFDTMFGEIDAPPEGAADGRGGDPDDDEASTVEAVCEAIKDSIWANPVKFFHAQTRAKPS